MPNRNEKPPGLHPQNGGTCNRIATLVDMGTRLEVVERKLNKVEGDMEKLQEQFLRLQQWIMYGLIMVTVALLTSVVNLVSVWLQRGF